MVDEPASYILLLTYLIVRKLTPYRFKVFAVIHTERRRGPWVTKVGLFSTLNLAGAVQAHLEAELKNEKGEWVHSSINIDDKFYVGFGGKIIAKEVPVLVSVPKVSSYKK